VTAPLWAWAALAAGFAVLLWVDLRAVRGDDVRRAAVWSGVWVAVALAFGAVLLAAAGGEPAGEYVTGYLIERTLSVDNVFVLALILSALGVAGRERDRALTFGIAGAILLRLALVLAGVAILQAAHWALYVFGAFLVLTGVRMALHRHDDADPSDSAALRLARRIAPRAGAFGVAIVAVTVADVIFAVDSIPAILAITTDTFVVVAANAFALLGLRSLYVLLAGAMDRFEHLQLGLAAVLVFVGAKMALPFVHVPVGVSLAVIAAIVAASMLASRRPTRRSGPARRGRGPTAAPPPAAHARAR